MHRSATWKEQGRLRAILGQSYQRKNARGHVGARYPYLPPRARENITGNSALSCPLPDLGSLNLEGDAQKATLSATPGDLLGVCVSSL